MAVAAMLELSRFAVGDLPLRDRHQAWVNRDWPSLAAIYETVPLQPFDIVTDRLTLGPLAVQYTGITAQSWRRDARRARADGADALCVAITVAGTARGTMAGRAFRTGPGSVQLFDLGQPSHHESSASRTILVAVPRAIAAARGIDVAALHGLVLESRAAAMIGPHLLAVREAAPGMAAADGPLLARTVLDLLSLAVAASGRGMAGAGPRDAARAAIEDGLGSAALGSTALCRRLGLSRSGLHRLFADEGGVQAYIRERRLQAARRALAAAAPLEPLQALAERLGFSDASHLGRLFRARFGTTPGEWRAAARTGTGQDL